MLGFVTIAIATGIFGYVAYSYLTAPAVMTTASLKPEDPPITRPSTTIDKLSYATKRSATLLVQLVTAGSVMLMNGVLSMADFFGGPEVKDWVMSLQLSPRIVSTVVMVLAAVTVWARVRNAIGGS